MKWYLCTGRAPQSGGSYDSSTEPTSYNVVSEPYIYNGEVWGGYEKPFYKFNLYRYSQGYVFEGRHFYTPTSSTRANAQSHSSKNYRPFLIGVVNGQNFTYPQGMFTEIENVKISGKYTLKNTIGGFAQYGNWTFPINFSVNGTIQKYICVSGFQNSFNIQYPFYNDYSGRNTSPTDTTPMQYFNTVTAVFENGEMTSFNSTSNFTAGDVLNFGDSLQDVPKFFYDWLTENATPVYEHTVTIKASTGETLTSLSSLPNIDRASLSTIGNNVTLSLRGVNGEFYFLRWTHATPPEGSQFLGLAFSPEDRRPSIPTGTSTDIEWSNDIVLYEVYGRYLPPSTTFTIALYRCDTENNRVDKSEYLTSKGSINGTLRDQSSIMSPSIIISHSAVPTFNYVYINQFGRYYFVKDITSISTDLWRIDMYCDVLYTYKDSIRATSAIIARQESDYNDKLVDGELKIESEPAISYQEISNNVLTTSSTSDTHSYVLTVISV